jgi:PAS domain S-box-containing protein
VSKRLKAGLPQQLRQLQLVTYESADGVIMIDINQQIRWANAAALAAHNVASTAELGRTIDEYHAKFQVKFHGVQDTRASETLDSVICGENYRDVVVEVTPLDRQLPKWMCRVRNMVMVDDSGNPSCIIQILRPAVPDAPANCRTAPLPRMQAVPDADLAQPASAAAPLDVVAQLCALAPVPLCVMDCQMRILDVSQAFLDWLGFQRQDVTGRSILTLMDASSAEHFEHHTLKALVQDAVAKTTISTFLSQAGRDMEAQLSTSVTLDAAGAPAFIVAAPTDISDRRQSEDAFTAAFTLAPVPMLITSLDDGRVLDANDAFMATAGHQLATIIGHGMDELGLFDSRTAKAQFEAGLRGADSIRNMHAKLKTAQNEVLDCLLSARRVNACGKSAVLLVLQDVSDRRRNEAQLFDAIQLVMADTTWFSRSVIEKLAALRAPPRPGLSHAEVGDLTPREREVLGLISQGMTDLDISQKLGLTRATVRNHVATLYSKIDVHSRSSAIVWARERGINVAWASTNPAPSRHGQTPAHRMPAPPKIYRHRATSSAIATTKPVFTSAAVGRQGDSD